MLIVIALGGNAVSLPGKEGNIADQFAATRGVCGPLADLIRRRVIVDLPKRYY